MASKEKMDFLNKYTLSKEFTVKLLNLDEINALNEEIIPNEWKDALRESKQEHKIKNVLSIWEKHVASEMSNTISFLSEFLIDVELMNIGGRYSMLYSLKNSKGKILYYEGRNPKDIFNNKQLKKVWGKFPEKIREFYENVHSGFYYYPSKSMGLSSLENVVCLDKYEWGIIEEIGIDNLKIDLTSSYEFFSNGMGTYVVIDYENCDDGNAVLWSSKEETEYSLNFWDVVDEWMVIGFE